MAELRHLVLVLGDQLDAGSSAFDDFDSVRDAVWMAEVAQEATHVWSSQPRIALFLAAMRHFAAALRSRAQALVALQAFIAQRLARNPRMALQVRNLGRLDARQREAIQLRAAAVRSGEVAA